MNKVILMGRLTRDPEVRYSQGPNGQFAVARYSLAVDRPVSRNNANGEATADFINCEAMDKNGEFAEKYLHKGMRILVEGRIVTGSYTNKDGVKVYTTNVRVERHEFCESKGSQGGSSQGFDGNASSGSDDGFMNIPSGVEDEVPFG